ncbi:MAG: HD domain-containing protein [Proteobacteria bacterium]|nr:HD domain-containing protein [Pseudomonadota bacterium]MBU1638886.1 HD domain-containing protein [Pseudomonadota bacterium]
MTKATNKLPLPPEGKRFLKRKGLSFPSIPLNRKIVSIRTKLTILTLIMVAMITTGSSIVAMQIIQRELLDSLVKRGASIALSAAIPAGFSILTEDSLALDNLAAKIEASDEDIVYLAILDNNGITLAHSKLSETGTLFETATGDPLKQGPDFTMHLVARNGLESYEFQTPIQFADNHVGSIIVGIDSATLLAAKESARHRISLISLAVLAFGALCTFMLSKLITKPIERLASGVSQITAGNYHIEVKVTSRDELGELTRSFNEMSRVIMSQKESLEGYASNLEESYLSTIRILAAALDARDNYTLGHSARVAQLSLLIGHRLSFAIEELQELEMACFLHDIGKIHVPDVIIHKAGPLSAEESLVIKKHPLQGAEILDLAESLHKCIPAVLHHHEWYNGEGYPYGLQGEEIHIHAQIVTIADSYDAMTSSRPYRKGCSRDEAIAEITKFRGIQFNPDLVDIFLVALGDYEDDLDLFSSGGIHEKHDFLYTHSSAVSGNADSLRCSAP